MPQPKNVGISPLSRQLLAPFYLPTSTPAPHPQYTDGSSPAERVILRGHTLSQVWPSRQQFTYCQGTTAPVALPWVMNITGVYEVELKEII